MGPLKHWRERYCETCTHSRCAGRCTCSLTGQTAHAQAVAGECPHPQGSRFPTDSTAVPAMFTIDPNYDPERDKDVGRCGC